MLFYKTAPFGITGLNGFILILPVVPQLKQGLFMVRAFMIIKPRPLHLGQVIYIQPLPSQRWHLTTLPFCCLNFLVPRQSLHPTLIFPYRLVAFTTICYYHIFASFNINSNSPHIYFLIYLNNNLIF